MFDIFYSGPKPDLFAHERKADSIEHAQQLSTTRYFWWVNYLCDYSGWDWLFEPKPWQSEYTHVWPSAWDQVHGACLVPRHAESLQYYHHNQLVPARVHKENFNVLVDCEFGWSWTPHPWDPPYVYVFGNQHWDGTLMPTVTYTMPGATEQKFLDWPVAQLSSNRANWHVLEPIDEDAWDWTWVPNPKEPPYIYVFGNQWNPPEFKASVEYHVPGATERKYMDRRTVRLPQKHLFKSKIAVADFDWSWEPNPFDPPYIYVFGNTWYSAEIEPSVEYAVPGATEIKYVSDIVARPWGVMADYEFLHDIELDQFDWTWHPNPNDPPYIYVFGNQWHAAEIMPTLKYHQPGGTESKYMDHPCATLVERHDNHWHTLIDCEWDYSWVPDPGDPPYIYVFGNQWHAAEIMPTVTYTVPGATEKKYMDYPRAKLFESSANWHDLSEHPYTFDYSWVPDPGDPPMVYVFGNQHWSAEKMPMVRYCASNTDESNAVKYMDYPIATLLPNRTLWTVPANVKEEQVDYTWVPDPGEPPYIYQFATQHQKTGGPVYTVPGATEIKYLEHVQVEIKTATVPIIEIDHLDGNAGQIPNTVKRIRYFDNYRDTLIRLAKSLVGEHEHVWVCSSICDYSEFDFSWHPEKWQGTMLHVFASDEQKFGDTFYMHVPTFAERAEKKQLLEWYSVNYVSRRRVPRRPVPVIQHSEDSQVDAVKNTDWAGPVALFTTTDYVDQALTTVPLWRQETKTIVPLSRGATSVIVPKSAKGHVRTQLYDYPYIDKTKVMLHDRPLDIVFISNGEPNADQHWQDLVYSLDRGHANRAVRVDGVNGRVAAYHAAAQASHTPWFFAVFAKLKVNPNFDWEWQPDCMQQPKHYIFHAENPVNGLVYGHQAMIAYNKKLALENMGQGLDFTLDQPHEVVPILSGIAFYADSPWMAWRTAFREVLKLRASLPDVESEYRLNKWLAPVEGKGEWSAKGAEDAVEFYDAVGGDFAELRKSYDWAWLASYAFMRRSLTTDQ
jgi:hypothetical protein